MIRVAILDDDPGVARGLARLYRASGCEVHVLAVRDTLAEACTSVSALGPDVLVCDHDLGCSYTGEDVLRASTARVRILHSGSVSESDAATHVVPKGADPKTFLDALVDFPLR